MTDANGYTSFNDLLRGKPVVPRPDAVPVTPDVLVSDNWAASGFRNVLAELAEAPDGVRNHKLNRAAWDLGQIVATGRLDEAQVVEALQQTALSIGLEPREVENSLRSGLNAGLKNPRQVKPLFKVTEVTEAQILEGLPAAPDASESDDDEEDDPWQPYAVDRVSEGLLVSPEPQYLVRADGKALLYGAKVNALIGESESGKSWLALLALVQAVRNGERCLILDFEDNARTAVTRLRAFGLTDDERVLVDYASPDIPLGNKQAEILRRSLDDGYGVIIVDGVNAAMVLLGLDLNSNTDATLFYRRLLRPLASNGACVIAVDHVPKNPEARGKGGIGAQAKRAMTSGASILVEVVEPFGKGQSGVLRLLVDKDRMGTVRGISTGGKVPGKVRFTSILDTVELVIEPPASEQAATEDWRPTGLMEKISELLVEVGEMSQNAIIKATAGNDHQIRKAIERLVHEGCVARRSGARGSLMYRSIKPFSADLGHLGQPRPDLGQKVAQRLRPATPIPLGGGRGQRSSDGSENSATSAKPDEQLRCRRCETLISEEQADKTDGCCPDCDRLENP